MNRQERRKLARQGISEEVIEKQRKNDLYEQGHKDGMLKAIEITFYMTAYTLDYKLDLDRNKLVEMMYWIYNNIDSFRTGHLTIEDFEIIKKEMHEKGVKLK